MQMADLSPEAQAVLDAAEIDFQIVFNDIETGIADFRRRVIVAALRAAARQAIPETHRPNSGNAIIDAFAYEAWNAKNIACLKLFAIADELENHKP
jgi:hypothetical protein